MKQKYTLFALVLLICCGGWSGCKFGNSGDPIVVADVEKEFNVSMIEQFEPGKRELLFQLSTIKNQPCQNYTIDYNWHQNGSVLDLNLSKIVAPEICQPGALPAAGVVYANTLESGSYALNVDFPHVDALSGQAALQVPFTIADGSTSLNDVLKGIVSLIASINKQIAALAKLVTKK